MSLHAQSASGSTDMWAKTDLSGLWRIKPRAAAQTTGMPGAGGLPLGCHSDIQLAAGVCTASHTISA